MNIQNAVRNLISRPAFQPFWSNLLKLCHAGMNYGGGQVIETSGELGALAFAARSFKPNQSIVLFDVGANDGDYIEGARRVLHSNDLHIFSFEPQRSCFLALQSRYLNDPLTSIRCVALGKECGTANLFYSDQGETTASLQKTNNAGHSESVELTTIDEVCRKEHLDRIDFLKIDTEGYEVDVLLGAQHMIEAGRVTALQFEFGDTFLCTSYHFCDVFNLLAPRYKIYRILRAGLVEIPCCTPDLEIFKCANFLCIQKESAFE